MVQQQCTVLDKSADVVAEMDYSLYPAGLFYRDTGSVYI